MYYLTLHVSHLVIFVVCSKDNNWHIYLTGQHYTSHNLLLTSQNNSCLRNLQQGMHKRQALAKHGQKPRLLRASQQFIKLIKSDTAKYCSPRCGLLTHNTNA
jgi:hypothetical protein